MTNENQRSLLVAVCTSGIIILAGMGVLANAYLTANKHKTAITQRAYTNNPLSSTFNRTPSNEELSARIRETSNSIAQLYLQAEKDMSNYISTNFLNHSSSTNSPRTN